MATVLTGQLVIAIAALCSATILAVFGVVDGDQAGAIIAGILGGFGLGAKHEQNATTSTPPAGGTGP